jgi:hypothetical protein
MAVVLAVVLQEILERHVPVVTWPGRDLLLLGDRIEPVLRERQVVGDRADDQLLEPRLAAHRRHLRIERRDIERHQDVGLAVAYFELKLARGIERAVVDHPAARLQHAEEGDQVVRRVGQVEPDIDARADAQLLEAGRGVVRRLLVVTEGHDLVEEVGERPLGVLGAALLEDLVDGLLRNLKLPFHAWRVALFPNVVCHWSIPPDCTMARDRRSCRPS